MFVASVIVIFYLYTPSGKNIQKQVNEVGEKPPEQTSITQLPTVDPTEISLRPQRVSSIETEAESRIKALSQHRQNRMFTPLPRPRICGLPRRALQPPIG